MPKPNKPKKRGAPPGNQNGRKHPIGEELRLLSARVHPLIGERLDKEAQDRSLSPSALLALIVTERYSPLAEDIAERRDLWAKSPHKTP